VRAHTCWPRSRGMYPGLQDLKSRFAGRPKGPSFFVSARLLVCPLPYTLPGGHRRLTPDVMLPRLWGGWVRVFF